MLYLSASELSSRWVPLQQLGNKALYVWEFDHVIQFVTKKDSFCDLGVRSVDLVFSFV